MKQIFNFLTLLLAVALLAGCKNEEPDFTKNIAEHFDEKFAIYLEEEGHIVNAKKFTIADVKDIEVLYMLNLRILENGQFSTYDLTSLAGIEYLTALKTLNCGSYRITSLDVSKNTALTYLDCMSNQLIALDVSKNTALTELYCGGNQLTVLDISKNTALRKLECTHNQFTTLDISNNTALEHLYCSSNQLSALNISNNTSLKELYCLQNPGNGTAFPVTAWFDNNSIPHKFTAEGWDFDGSRIDIEYIKK